MPETNADLTDLGDIKIRLKKEDLDFSLDKSELRRLAEILQERADAAAEIELAHFKPLDLAPEEESRQRALLKESFELKFSINGSDSRELFGPIAKVFGSPNFPEDVTTLYVGSANTLRAVHNYYPRNSFQLLLDFSRPAVFDFRVLPGLHTPNGSSLEVEGYDATWANGVFREIEAFLASKPAKIAVIHRHTVYDLLLYLIGFPFAFWVCQKASAALESEFATSVLIRNAMYVYIFMASLVVVRVLFHYLRWVFPLAEFRSSVARMLAHRAVLAGLAIALFGSFLYDIGKTLLGFD